MKHILCVLLLLCLLFPAQSQKVSPNIALIYGEIRAKEPVDTIEVTVWDNLLDQYSLIPSPDKQIIKARNGTIFESAIGMTVFELEVPVNTNSSRISISSRGARFIDQFLVEPGDTIRMRFDLIRGATVFAGPDAPKFRLQHELELLQQSEDFNYDPAMYAQDSMGFLKNPEHMAMYKEAQASAIGRKLRFILPEDEMDELQFQLDQLNTDKAQVRLLNHYSTQVDTSFLKVMKADMVGKQLYPKLRIFNRMLNSSDQIRSMYDQIILPISVSHVELQAILRSPAYQDYLLMRTLITSRMSSESIISVLDSNYPPPLRDALISKYFVRYHRRIKDLDNELSNALQLVDLDWAREIIEELSMSLSEGSPLGNFTLTDINGEQKPISDFYGKTLLLDFWLPGCKACINFYRNRIKPVEEHFQGRNDVIILSISTDKEMESWKKKVESGLYSNSEGINLTTEGYDHPLLAKYNIHIFPYQLLVDSNGNIARAAAFPSNAGDLIKLIESVSQKD